MRILILALVLLVSSCTTQKKAEKWYRNNKAELAKLCLDCFEDKKDPVYIKGDTRIDTLEVKGDTVTVEGDCPDGTKIEVDCPPNKTITINSARIDTIYKDKWQTLAHLEVQNELIQDLSVKLAIATEQKNNWRAFALWGWGLIIIFTLYKAITWRK